MFVVSEQASDTTMETAFQHETSACDIKTSTPHLTSKPNQKSVAVS